MTPKLIKTDPMSREEIVRHLGDGREVCVADFYSGSTPCVAFRGGFATLADVESLRADGLLLSRVQIHRRGLMGADIPPSWYLRLRLEPIALTESEMFRLGVSQGEDTMFCPHPHPHPDGDGAIMVFASGKHIGTIIRATAAEIQAARPLSAGQALLASS